MDPDIRRGPGRALVPVVAVLALLGLGGWGAVTAGEGLAYATAVAGTRGELVADRCLRTDPARPAQGTTGDCRGTFFPDGGGQANEHAWIDWKIATGERVEVSCTGDGECRLVGAAGVLFWLSILLLALAALPVAGFVAVHQPLRPLDRSQRLRVGLGIAAAVLLVGAFAAFVGALVGR
ncbi:hypothetical protein [Streptomyces sp. BE303]|uniref:hypothetical protein n=2 Tax=Streptomycetaceae TaxID=2062 RepID=UPI002E773C0B|nr:hypothetical protein [Streptomyces sp. BE303]MED7955333.1 hypothetical protein [Streptomyces sp. BE303]